MGDGQTTVVDGEVEDDMRRVLLDRSSTCLDEWQVKGVRSRTVWTMKAACYGYIRKSLYLAALWLCCGQDD